jgi:hypothetical protein
MKTRITIIMTMLLLGVVLIFTNSSTVEAKSKKTKYTTVTVTSGSMKEAKKVNSSIMAQKKLVKIKVKASSMKKVKKIVSKLDKNIQKANGWNVSLVKCLDFSDESSARKYDVNNGIYTKYDKSTWYMENGKKKTKHHWLYSDYYPKKSGSYYTITLDAKGEAEYVAGIYLVQDVVTNYRNDLAKWIATNKGSEDAEVQAQIIKYQSWIDTDFTKLSSAVKALMLEGLADGDTDYIVYGSHQSDRVELNKKWLKGVLKKEDNILISCLNHKYRTACGGYSTLTNLVYGMVGMKTDYMTDQGESLGYNPDAWDIDVDNYAHVWTSIQVINSKGQKAWISYNYGFGGESADLYADSQLTKEIKYDDFWN